MHLPAYNSVEHIVGTNHVHQVSSAIELTSPAQPLAAANFATVMNAVDTWSFGVERCPGLGLDLRARTTVPLQNVAWRTVIVQKNNLGLNNNIVGEIERVNSGLPGVSVIP